MTCRSILTGVNIYTLANVTRFALPLLVAFWPVLGVAALSAVRNSKDWRIRAILIWIVPGSLFFALIHISTAPYLNFLSAAILLLAVAAPRLMAVTALWNTVLFLAICPIPSQKLVFEVANDYVLAYTRYGIRHQWQPHLSQEQQTVN